MCRPRTEIGPLCRAKPVVIQVAAALIALVVGVLVYLLDRPSTSIYLVPNSWSFGDSVVPPVFGVIGNHVPTFVHTFSFTLLTSALLTPWRWSAVTACLLWWLIGSGFEIAQRDAWAKVIAEQVPDWFAEWPLLNNVAGYFSAGRFDAIDLLSISLASLSAYVVIRLSTRCA